MKVITTIAAFGDSGNIAIPIGIELTRRNLQALLAKLDEPGSLRTIRKEGIFITAVEDDAHYAAVEAGPMSLTTETAITRMRESGVVKCA